MQIRSSDQFRCVFSFPGIAASAWADTSWLCGVNMFDRTTPFPVSKLSNGQRMAPYVNDKELKNVGSADCSADGFVGNGWGVGLSTDFRSCDSCRCKITTLGKLFQPMYFRHQTG